MIDDAMYSYLSTYAGLVALVSKRIYPIVMPLNVTLPAVSYQRISTERVHAFSSGCNLSSFIMGKDRHGAKGIFSYAVDKRADQKSLTKLQRVDGKHDGQCGFTYR
jgi:hypothetical protein